MVAKYLVQKKSLELLARNLHLEWGEVDILAKDPQTQERWIVEVRGKRDFSREPVDWLSARKIERLRKLAHYLCLKSGVPHQVLFVQVHLKMILEKPEGTVVKASIEEYEV